MADDANKPKKPDQDDVDRITGGKASKAGRAALNVASSLPVIGGILSAAAGAWSEREQEQVNLVFTKWFEAIEEELKEKAQTILEIMARLDMQDETINERITSDSYQSILEKTFKKWSNVDSEKKRLLVRNLLANAAASRASSDDVVRLFVDWLTTYSIFHFEVIGEIYNNPGVTRGQIWRNLGREAVREDSADADLYKLLIRDLSMGSVIRQRRETDAYGNFIPKKPAKRRSGGSTMKSAFDDEEQYELTDLGQQFVHYTMNELVPRVEFHPGSTYEGSE